MTTRVGRPRDPGVDRAAMAGAMRLLTDGGYAALTMEGIALEAGVSKAALYRRWENKASVVASAVEQFSQLLTDVPDTGTLRGDITAYLERFVRARTAGERTADALGDAIAADPVLRAACRETLVGPSDRAFQLMVRRGVERGELPAGTDLELLSRVAPALIRYHVEMIGAPPDLALVGRIVDAFFPAAR